MISTTVENKNENGKQKKCITSFRK